MKVAVFGYGYWGPNHVRAFAQLLGEERVVLCEPDAARRKAATERFPRLEAVETMEQVLADSQVGAAILCTPAGMHAEQATELLLAGRHTLVEKPLATSSVEGAKLSDLAARQNLVLMAGHIFLFHPVVRELRRLIEAGELGEIRYVTSIRSSLGPRVRDEVNIVWDYLIHDTYIVPYLLGRQPETARADGGSWLHPGIADVAFATLAFDDGAVAHLQSSWYYPTKARRMVVVGSRRMAVWDDTAEPGAAGSPLMLYDRGYTSEAGTDSWGNKDLRLYDDGAQPVALEAAEPLRLECQHFLDCIASGEEPIAGGGSATETLRLLEAIDESMANGGVRSTAKGAFGAKAPRKDENQAPAKLALAGGVL
jgi:predicted dehydrogenase